MSARVTSWSYSRYEVYTRCPLQFKLKFLDKIPEPGSPAMQRGNEIHQGIAAYLTGKSAGCPREALQHPQMEQLILEIRNTPDQNKQVEQQWGYKADFAPTTWFGTDTWFRSILDAGVMYADMTFEAVDWKTGKRYSSNDAQMETQALSVFKRFKPVTHVTTRLAYLDSGEQEFAEVPATHAERLADKWRKKVEPMFNDRVFAPRPNEKCRFCHYSRSVGGQCAFG